MSAGRPCMAGASSAPEIRALCERAGAADSFAGRTARLVARLFELRLEFFCFFCSADDIDFGRGQLALVDVEQHGASPPVESVLLRHGALSRRHHGGFTLLCSRV